MTRPEQAPEVIRDSTGPPKEPKPAKLGGKKKETRKNVKESEISQVWATKPKKMSIPLRAVVKEPRKEVRKGPKGPAEEISNPQEESKQKEANEVRNSSGDSAMASTEKPPEKSLGSEPEEAQVVVKSYPPSTEEGLGPEKEPVDAKRTGKGIPVSGYLLPSLAQTHGVEGRMGEIVVLFKGKPERIKADTMIMEGDQDPALKGVEARRVMKAAGPGLEVASLLAGKREIGGIRMTPGFLLPCRKLFQVVHTMGQDLKNLYECYSTALDNVAVFEPDHTSVVFSLLGTAMNLQVPVGVAARVAFEAISRWVRTRENKKIDRIVLCTPGPPVFKEVEKALHD